MRRWAERSSDMGEARAPESGEVRSFLNELARKRLAERDPQFLGAQSG